MSEETGNNVSNDMEMEKREEQPQKSGGGSIIAIIIILIIIAGLFYFIKGKKTGETTRVTEILPQTCAVLAQLNLENIQDAQMKEETKKKFFENESIKKSIADFEKENQMNFKEDVLSWMGEQFAITVLEMPKGGGDDPADHFVALMTVKDPAIAKEKIKAMADKKQIKFTEETYENNTLWVSADPKKPSYTFLKGFIVLSNSREDLKKCVDASNRKVPTLKDNPQFSEVAKQLPATPVAMVYLDLKTIIEAGKSKMAQVPPEIEKFQKALQGVGFGIAIDKTGDLIGQGFVGLDKTSDSVIAKGIFSEKPAIGTPSTLKLFPKSATIYNAFDIKMVYNILMAFVKSMPNGEQNVNQFKQMAQSQIGLDIDKDIIENLSGEIAYVADYQDLVSSALGKSGMPDVAQNNLRELANSMEAYSAENGGKYPEKLEQLVPKNMKELPAPPSGTQYYYKKQDTPARFMIAYSVNGQIPSNDYPMFDSETGMASKPRGNEAMPMLLAIKLKDKAKFGEAIGKITAKMGPLLRKKEISGVSFFEAPNILVGTYEDFFMIAVGKGSKLLEETLKNKMDEKNSLAVDPGFDRIKGKLGPSTVSVSMANISSITSTLKMFVAMTALQSPQAGQQAQAFLSHIEQYETMWSFSEMIDNGLRFEFFISKKQAK